MRMLRYLYCFLAAIIILFTFSCKKDLLHLQKVQKLTTNTTATINHIRFISDNICIAAGGKTFTSQMY